MKTWITYERETNPGTHSAYALRNGSMVREAARVISRHRTQAAADRERAKIVRSGRSPVSVGVLCE